MVNRIKVNDIVVINSSASGPFRMLKEYYWKVAVVRKGIYSGFVELICVGDRKGTLVSINVPMKYLSKVEVC